MLYSTKKSSGSALVYSLIILFVMLTVALGTASVSVVERKNATSTGKSIQSFQVADSAVEKVLKKASDSPTANLGDLASYLYGTCESNGVVKADILGSPVQLVFYKGEGVNREQVDDCTATTLAEVREVKSVGQYANTTRAINAAVAAGTTYQQVYNNVTGALPAQPRQFTTVGKDSILVLVNAVVQSVALNPGTVENIGVKVLIDGGNEMQAYVALRPYEYVTNGSFHHVGGSFVISDLPSGGHTMTITKLGPATAQSDGGGATHYNVVVVE